LIFSRSQLTMLYDRSHRGLAGIKKACDLINLIECLKCTKLCIPFDPSTEYGVVGARGAESVVATLGGGEVGDGGKHQGMPAEETEGAAVDALLLKDEAQAGMNGKSSASKALGEGGARGVGARLHSVLKDLSCHVRMSSIISKAIDQGLQGLDQSHNLYILCNLLMALRPCHAETYLTVEKVFKSLNHSSQPRCKYIRLMLNLYQKYKEEYVRGSDDVFYVDMIEDISGLRERTASDTARSVLENLVAQNPTIYDDAASDPESEAFFEVRRQFVQWAGAHESDTAREWSKRIRDSYVRCELIMTGKDTVTNTKVLPRTLWRTQRLEMQKKVTRLCKKVEALELALRAQRASNTSLQEFYERKIASMTVIKQDLLKEHQKLDDQNHSLRKDIRMLQQGMEQRKRKRQGTGSLLPVPQTVLAAPVTPTPTRGSVPPLPLNALSETREGVPEEMQSLCNLLRELRGIGQEMLDLLESVPEGHSGIPTGVRVDTSDQADEGTTEGEPHAISEDKLCKLLQEISEIDEPKASSQTILESDKTSRPFSTAQSHREHYYLKPVLAKFMGLDTACLSEVMKRFWSYILKQGLIQKDDMRYCRVDKQLCDLFPGSQYVHILDCAIQFSQHFASTMPDNGAHRRGGQGQGDIAKGFEHFQVDTP